MRQAINLVEGMVTLKTSTVGPKHDPYARTIIERTDAHGHPVWKITLCSLAGDFLQDRFGKFMDPNEGESFANMVLRVTGQTTYFWEHKVWEYKERALERRLGREKYQQLCFIREADDRLLRYAM